MAFNVEETAAAAMARKLRSTRFAGASHTRWPSDAEIDRELAGYERYDTRDEPLSDDVTAAGEWQDAVADRLYDEPEDRTLTDEFPPGYDERIWGRL